MEKKSFIWLIVGLVWITFFCFGCGQKAKEEKVVARVNDYAMIIKDLKDEIKNAPYTADKAQDIEELLDLAIRKQILIQEAQRQGLDRKKSFMKTIERYWEQTLIKELLKEETLKVYERSKLTGKEDETLDGWMEDLYKKANIKIYKDMLKELEKER